MNQTANKEKIKGVEGQAYVYTGIVEEITPIACKFGFSWRIKMGGAVYYFNSKIEDMADRMFRVNKKAAFTVKESGKYLVINQVLYVFE